MRQTVTFVLSVLVIALMSVGATVVARAQGLPSDVDATLRSLYDGTPAARELAPRATGILVFPDISRDTNANIAAVQSGNGALLIGGRIVGYYTATSIAYGLQAGTLSFATVVFLMTDSALSRLEQAEGWEVGKDPGVVIIPAGTPHTPAGTMDTQAGTMDTTSGTMAPPMTARPDTYAYVLGDAGLATGVGRQGWKIVKVRP